MTIPQKHPGMTNAEFKVLGDCIRSVGDKMGLRDWLFNVKYQPPTKEDGTENIEAAAQCEPVYGKKVANLWFARNFRHEVAPERQVVFVVHELLHCHFDGIDTLTRNALENHLGQIYYHAWHPGFVHQIEQTVNAIAEEWAKVMPMIKWPAKKKPTRRR